MAAKSCRAAFRPRKLNRFKSVLFLSAEGGRAAPGFGAKRLKRKMKNVFETWSSFWYVSHSSYRLRFRCQHTGSQLGAAVGAFLPCRFHRALVVTADWAQFSPTLWAENKARAPFGAAPRTADQERFAQDKIQDDAYGIGDKHRQQRPHDIAHATASGVGVNVADDKHPNENQHGWPDRKQRSSSRVPVVKSRMMGDDKKKQKRKHRQRAQSRQDPGNGRDDSNLVRKFAHTALPSC